MVAVTLRRELAHSHLPEGENVIELMTLDRKLQALEMKDVRDKPATGA